MKVVCALCGRGMAEKPPYEALKIAHSICNDCLPKMLKSACPPASPSPQFRERLLERLIDEVNQRARTGRRRDKVRSVRERI